MRFLYMVKRECIAGRLINLFFLSFFLVIVLISVSLASTITVNTTNDTHAAARASSPADGSGNVSLRSALEFADAVGGTNIINFSVSGTINLSLGEISFGNTAENITIDGAGQSIVINMTNTNQDRIFLIDPPGTVSNVVVTLQNLTFQNGHLTSDPYGGGAILAGGPSDSLTIHNCVFKDNTVPNGNGTGGAINFSGGGTLTIDQGSSFKNNQDLDVGNTGGGAVFYFLQSSVNLAGSLNITNCTFDSNTTDAPSSGTSGGGAIGIQIQGQLTGQTLSALIIQNTFTNNSATAGFGGAVIVENAFAAGNTVYINYNRFEGNTALAGGGGLAYISENSSVDATNNWWGTNSVPSSSSTDGAGTFHTGGSGSLITSSWLELTLTPSQSSICANSSTTITASFLKNSNNQSISTSNLGALTGLPINFSATAPTGSNISNAQTAIQSAGTATALYNAGSTGGAGNASAMIDNGKATTSITVDTPPSVTTNPVNHTVNDGTSVTFSAAADGNPTPSVQWQVSTDNGGSWNNINNEVSSDLSFTASVTQNGNQYRAIFGNTCNNNVATTAAILKVIPPPPTAITASNVQSTSFSANWDAVTGASGYRIDVATDISFNSILNNYNNLDAGNAITISITGLTLNTPYYYRVRAYNSAGTSDNSNTIEVSTPLPVELTSFSAEVVMNSINLKWNTATEVNDYGFEIQRSAVSDQQSATASTDSTLLMADNWQNIGFVKGSGNSNSPKIYSFVDNNPLNGTVVYRLKQIDNDGNFKFSQIIAVNSLPTKFELYQNYPNPFNPATTIRYDIPYNSEVRLILFNMLGQKVKQLVNKIQSAGYYKYNWNAGGLASGIYIYMLKANSTDGNKSFQSIKKMILLK